MKPHQTPMGAYLTDVAGDPNAPPPDAMSHVLDRLPMTPGQKWLLDKGGDRDAPVPNSLKPSSTRHPFAA